jgi:hypothetical protein
MKYQTITLKFISSKFQRFSWKNSFWNSNTIHAYQTCISREHTKSLKAIKKILYSTSKIIVRWNNILFSFMKFNMRKFFFFGWKMQGKFGKKNVGICRRKTNCFSIILTLQFKYERKKYSCVVFFISLFIAYTKDNKFNSE